MIDWWIAMPMREQREALSEIITRVPHDSAHAPDSVTFIYSVCVWFLLLFFSHPILSGQQRTTKQNAFHKELVVVVVIDKDLRNVVALSFHGTMPRVKHWQL